MSNRTANRTHVATLQAYASGDAKTKKLALMFFQQHVQEDESFALLLVNSLQVCTMCDGPSGKHNQPQRCTMHAPVLSDLTPALVASQSVP